MAGTESGVVPCFQPEYTSFAAHQEATLTFSAHLQARSEPEDSDNMRSTVSLSAVLDKSGSMSGTKLNLVKKTSEFMMQNLSAKDKLGVVCYDSSVDELIKLTRTTEAFKRGANERIQGVCAGTCTNLSGGLFKGIEQQQKGTFLDFDSPPSEDGPPSPTAPSLPSTATSVTDESFEVLDVPLAGAPLAPAPPPPPDTTHAGKSKAKGSGIISRIGGMFAPSSAGGAAAASTRRAPSSRAASNPLKKAASMGGLKGILAGKDATHAVELEADAVRSVFLFTDGLANEGIKEADKLVEILQKMLDKTPRVRVYTFGYGGDHSSDLLQRIAQAGGGTYYFIENEENIPTAFADALGGLLSVAAQNVEVTFEPAPGVAVLEAHTTTYRTSEGAGGSRTVSVGDMFCDESKDLLFDVRLPALAAPQDGYVVGSLTLAYLDVHGACLRTEELLCTVDRPAEVPAELRPSAAVAMQKARVVTARTLSEAKKECDGRRYSAAREQIQREIGALNLVQQQVVGDEASEVMAAGLVSDLEEALTNMVDENTYARRGSKLMRGKAAMHYNQRAAALSDEEEWNNSDSDDEDMGGGLFDDDGDAGAPAGAPAPAKPKKAARFTYSTKAQVSMRKKAKSFFG